MNTLKVTIIGMAVVVLGLLQMFPVHTQVSHKPFAIAPRSPLTPRKSVGVSIKGLRAFMQHVGRRESDGHYDAVNRFGMLGKYQFHPATLRSLGIDEDRAHFLASPALQDSAMRQYMRDNRTELRPLIRLYSGTVVHGVFVTESGILAAAHLAGTTGVLTFFHPERYAGKTRDANGTTVAMYMMKFAGYNLRGL